jgi:glycosyltransferase involved in cell wall biosynthesis
MSVIADFRWRQLDGRQQNTSSGGGLTVVLPTYNHGHFISQAIDSLIAQTRKPDRIIVLDDASTDDTASVVRKYLVGMPSLEFIREETNQGVVAMLNRGLSLADTEYISFLAADDFIKSDLYAKSLDILDRFPAAAVSGVKTLLIAEDGSPMPSPSELGFGTVAKYLAPQEAVNRLSRFAGLFGGNGAVYRVAKLRALGGFANDLLSFCDGYAMQVLAARHGVCVIPERLAVWRRSRTSFAAASQANALTCEAILRAVENRRTREGAIFPAAYQKRLEGRLRYAAVVAAICETELNARVLADVLPDTSRHWFRALALVKRFGGRPLVQLLVGVWLRPFDIFTAFRRRFLLKTASN